MTGKSIRIWQKLQKMKASNYEIAAGVACGVAISFTPFVGFHLLLAAITALLLRASVTASALGTLVGNPWTFPFIWAAVLYTGEAMQGLDNHRAGVDFSSLFHNVYITLKHLDFAAFMQDFWPIFYAMMIGSIPFYLLFWIISYIVTEHLLKKYRKQNNDSGDRH